MFILQNRDFHLYLPWTSGSFKETHNRLAVFSEKESGYLYFGIADGVQIGDFFSSARWEEREEIRRL